MSSPIYNGGLVGRFDSQRRPYVADDGNWSLQGNLEGPEFRTLLLRIKGVDSFGYLPLLSREPYGVAIMRDGVFKRPELLAWRGPVLEPGVTVEMVVMGGNHHYYGPQGDDPDDWMEWGSQDPTDVSKRVLATTGPMVVPGVPSIPPLQDSRLSLDKRLPTIRDNTLTELGRAKASYGAWEQANPKEALAVENYLAMISDVHVRPMPPAPPELRTPKGRGIVGILQAGAATIERLP